MQLKQRLTFLKALLAGQLVTSTLRSRTVHSGAWIGVGFALQKVLQLGSNLILTRLLFPEAFGLMALATVFLIGLALFSDVGLKPAIIRDPRGDDTTFLNTAWTIQVGRGLLLAVIGAAIAYPISLLYSQPILFPLLSVVSIAAAISGFASIGMITAERRLDFRIITIVQLSGQATAIFLLITISFFWRSVWALAVANIIGAGLTVIIGHVVLPKHQHRLTINPEAARYLLGFGKWILFSTISTYLGGEGLKALQARFITPTEFGVLAIAYTIAGIPNDLTAKLSGSLGFPVIAEVYRNAPANARGVLHRLRLRTLTISLILYAGVMLLADPVIRLLYDTRYHDASAYLVALALGNAIASVAQGYTSAVLAIGNGKTYFALMTVFALARIAGVTQGFEEGGIVGMLYGICIANLVVNLSTWLVIARLSLLDLKLDFCLFGMIGLFWIVVWHSHLL